MRHSRAGPHNRRRPAVLKVSWADRETEHEHTALAAWGGTGAVCLLAADGPRRVILMERLDPSRSLGFEPIDEAVDTLAGCFTDSPFPRRRRSRP